jgi:hypothetical protein
MDRVLDRPIIFIGNGRSGTSIVFGVFSVHEDLGWLSNYIQSFPIHLVREYPGCESRCWFLPLRAVP